MLASERVSYVYYVAQLTELHRIVTSGATPQLSAPLTPEAPHELQFTYYERSAAPNAPLTRTRFKTMQLELDDALRARILHMKVPLVRDGIADKRVSGGVMPAEPARALCEQGRIEKSDWARGEEQTRALPRQLNRVAQLRDRDAARPFIVVATAVGDLHENDVIVLIDGASPANPAEVVAAARSAKHATVWRPPRAWIPR